MAETMQNIPKINDQNKLKLAYNTSVPKSKIINTEILEASKLDPNSSKKMQDRILSYQQKRQFQNSRQSLASNTSKVSGGRQQLLRT